MGLLILFISTSSLITLSWATISFVPEISIEAQRLLLQLCPELSDDGGRGLRHYRYDNATATCYLAIRGLSGPCEENMAFFAEDDVYGFCACNDVKPRPLIFHRNTEPCYFIYTQAYCPSGQWLTINVTTNNPECATNPCNNDSNQELVYFNNRCVQLDSWQPECKQGQTVQFNEDSLEPQCECDYTSSTSTRVRVVDDSHDVPIPITPAPPASISITLNRCKPGHLRSITGGCQRRFSWG